VLGRSSLAEAVGRGRPISQGSVRASQPPEARRRPWVYGWQDTHPYVIETTNRGERGMTSTPACSRTGSSSSALPSTTSATWSWPSCSSGREDPGRTSGSTSTRRGSVYAGSPSTTPCSTWSRGRHHLHGPGRLHGGVWRGRARTPLLAAQHPISSTRRAADSASGRRHPIHPGDLRSARIDEISRTTPASPSRWCTGLDRDSS